MWLLIFGVGLAWRAQNLTAFGLTNDEGAYLMWSQLPLDGYPLYSETRAVQPPLFFEWVGLALRLGGANVAAGRWSTLLSYGLLALALSWLAYRDRGRVAALTSVTLLTVAPLIFRFSRLVMAEIPATALAVLSLALLFAYVDRRHKRWLLASGLVFGISMLVKTLNPFVLLPVGLVLVWHAELPAKFRQGWRTLFINSLWWAGGALVPLLAVLLIYDRAAMFEQTVAFRGDLRAAIPGSWAETWGQFVVMVQEQWAVWLLAGGGIITAWLSPIFNSQPQTKERDGHKFYVSPFFCSLVWLVWLLAGGAMLAWHTPLFPHHWLVLFPPLILLGSGFVADGLAWRRTQPGWALLVAALVLGASLNLPAMIAANQAQATLITGGREAEAINFLQTVTTPTDFVMGDSQLLIYMAGRRTPPPLGDVALVAIKAGLQTSARMIKLSEDYHAAAVTQWSLRLPWLPDYLTWVEAHYLARRVWDNDHIIYFVPRVSANQVPHAQASPLGEVLVLRGYDLDPGSFKAGQPLTLRFYWQVEVPVEEEYTMFTQVLNGDGVLVAGWDSQPLGGHFPTSQWPVGEIVTDRLQVPLPADLPVGDYTLITGVYLLKTLERLTTPSGVDHLTLTTLPLRPEH